MIWYFVTVKTGHADEHQDDSYLTELEVHLMFFICYQVTILKYTNYTVLSALTRILNQNLPRISAIGHIPSPWTVQFPRSHYILLCKYILSSQLMV